MHIIFKNIIDVYNWKQSMYSLKYDHSEEFASKSLEYIILG
jgi:hypothetical protein